jgi:ABC-type multidrug transport system fused ATPase/permease subunit
VRDLPNYISLFQKQLGPRIYVALAAALVAALSETFGIIMVLPLLQRLGGDNLGAPSTDAPAAADITPTVADPILPILLLIMAAFLCKGALTLLARGYIAYLRAQLLRELKGRLLDDYSRMRFSYYASRDTGHFMNVINGQVNQMLSAFQELAQVGSHLITSAIFVLVAIVMAWQFGLMALAAGLAILMLFNKINTYVRTVSRLSSLENGRLVKLLVQFLHGFKFLTATAQSRNIRSHVAESLGLLSRYEMRKDLAQAFTQVMREPAAVVLIMSIIYVQLDVLQQPLGPAMVSLLLFHRAFQALTQIQVAWQGTLKNIGAVELVRDEFQAQKDHREPTGDIPTPPLSKAIELRGVCFRYDDELPLVLTDVSMMIRARTSVALVGESGAGKSTAADLLTLMLEPERGQVLIDGVPGNKIVKDTWRRQIGYVSQETVVFDDTVANNISMWSGDFSTDPDLAERVQVAARKAHIAHFIDTLQDGYQTLVGDRGVRLSGGQRQRLFIARELFREPSLLILDEATSALDTESERAVQRSIDALRGEVTVVMIAHRLSTIRQVDQVFVFDKGRLVESGSYDELKEREDSAFGRLVAMQAL